MKRLTALLAALMALAMMSGPSVASEMGLFRQLSPNTFGTGYVPDGVSEAEFSGTIDTHYGVAPAWEVKAEAPLTMVEKAEKNLRSQLAPNALGAGFIPDGVSYEAFRGTIDTHYGVAPAWEDRPEDLTMIEKVEKDLNKHLAPNGFYRDIYGSDVN